jgi:hypothetical protein
MPMPQAISRNPQSRMKVGAAGTPMIRHTARGASSCARPRPTLNQPRPSAMFSRRAWAAALERP